MRAADSWPQGAKVASLFCSSFSCHPLRSAWPMKPRAENPVWRKLPPAITVARRGKTGESAGGRFGSCDAAETQSQQGQFVNLNRHGQGRCLHDGQEPIPEEEQFHFKGAFAHSGKRGPRLCLPVEVPKNYKLTIQVQAEGRENDPRVGVGLVLDGHQFFVESQRRLRPGAMLRPAARLRLPKGSAHPVPS